MILQSYNICVRAGLSQCRVCSGDHSYAKCWLHWFRYEDNTYNIVEAKRRLIEMVRGDNISQHIAYYFGAYVKEKFPGESGFVDKILLLA